ncbi:M20 family metallopeptidase [Tissierella carlieri]|jgi:amidohydrolase|uniref:M20 metallopeptidase family protein n=1 Tax=Tissierella carlieri TaxID=689904 RepID=UPI002803A278|nr:M20 family metallopeptidase [uncultured Tissierella sp.]MDU5082542.1 M20 family metallopeptidase [Bacillota bacterium]
MLKLEELKKLYEEEVIEFRRDLHMYPELSFKEYRTTEKIKEKLISLGIEIMDLGMETGVVGLLKGKEEGPTIALRGDIDALPIQELNDVPYKSKIDGVMHACGHDFHASSVIGAAIILSDIKNKLNGNVMFVFQPAEEINKGAKVMVEKGLFTDYKADLIFGLHNNPEIPWGKIAIKKDGLMAAVDTIRIKVKGKGGHGAIPNATRDPIIAASAMLMNLQTIVSRNVSPLDSAVISIGTFNSGTANNVISELVEMSGTVRSFDLQVRQMLPKRIKEVLEYTAKAYMVDVELEYIFDLPAVFNDDELTKLAYDATKEIVGEEGIVDPIPSMGGEDFSIFTEKVPGFFFWLGVGNKEKDMNYVWHNPRFDGDDRAVITASAVMSNMVLHGIKYANENKNEVR